jgi:hypothetical protein
MSKKIRVDFYQVNIPESNLLFKNIIQQVSEIPDDSSRTTNVYGFSVRLQNISRQLEFWRGDLVRIRMDELPTIVSLEGDVEPIDLEDDEGIGEETAFLYHIPTNVLMLQRNRYGVSASRLARYFQVMSGEINKICFDPILKGDVMLRLAKMRDITKFELRVAGVDDLSYLKNEDRGVEEVLNIRETFNSPNISLTVSVGNRNESLSVEGIKRTANNLFNFAARGRSTVKKIEVSGCNDDDQKEVFDLLEYWMRESVDIKPVDARILSYQERMQAIEEAWTRKKDELTLMFPSRAN